MNHGTLKRHSVSKQKHNKNSKNSIKINDNIVNESINNKQNMNDRYSKQD